MAKREKLTHTSQKEGEPDYEVPVSSSSDWRIFLEGLYRWSVIWLVVDLVALVILFFFFSLEYPLQILYTGTINLGISVVIIMSTVSGLTSAQNPLLYVEGTGAIEDMRDAKKRAFSFSMPFTAFLHALLFFLIYFVLTTLGY